MFDFDFEQAAEDFKYILYIMVFLIALYHVLYTLIYIAVYGVYMCMNTYDATKHTPKKPNLKLKIN